MEELQSANSIPAVVKKTVEFQQPTLLSSLRNILFCIGSALIGFAAFRNTLTWHLERFWGASGDFWQFLWDRLLDVIGDDPFTLIVYVLTTYTFVLYWMVGSFYVIMDVTNKPAALRKYKTQPGTNEPVDKKRLKEVIGRVLFNQTVVAIPFAYLNYYTAMWRGLPPVRELPTFHWVLVELAVFIITVEIAFYYAHRLLHNRHLYRFIHKKHHEWTAPIAVTAEYCHPVEHVFSNLFPVILGPFIMGSHIATILLWVTIAISTTLKDHSGYNFPFLPSPEPHDFHHLKFNQCYGVIGVLDRLHGTDDLFRSSKAYKCDAKLNSSK